MTYKSFETKIVEELNKERPGCFEVDNNSLYPTDDNGKRINKPFTMESFFMSCRNLPISDEDLIEYCIGRLIEFIDTVRLEEDFDSIKDNIIMTVSDRNLELALIPHRMFYDIPIIYKILWISDAGEFIISDIAHGDLMRWGQTENALYECAKKNTRKLLPPVINSAAAEMEMVADKLDDDEIDDETLENEVWDIDGMKDVMFIATNSYRTLGAFCMFYTDKLKELADYLNGNLVIIPICPDYVCIQKYDPSDIHMVKNTFMQFDINEHTAISKHLFIFDRNTQEIKPLE